MSNLDLDDGDGPWRDDLEPGRPEGMPAGRQVAAPRERGSLLPGVFLGKVATEVTEHLPSREGRPESTHRGRLAKFWYGPHTSVHYEIWLHDRTLQIEMGLHFESTPDYNLAIYNAFDRCLLEIQAVLGPSMWLEEWDHGWARLYETVPLFPLDAARVEEISTRMCEIIATLQPILEEIMSSLPDPPPVTAERRRDRHTPRR